MARKFEDAGSNSGKRRWMCFVCGKRNEDYDQYKNHIILEHDEGREYLKCPVCMSPVRDMKSHFKVKHPSRPYPKGVQDRVIIWRDFDPTGTKKRTRMPQSRKGEHDSPKMECLVHYRSGLEEEVYTQLDRDTDVKGYWAEPFKIPYNFEGKWHDYNPDIRVDFIDGSVEVWEVKPANQTDLPVNKAKWTSANNYCENVGWKFNVITEVGLGKLKAKVKRQLK